MSEKTTADIVTEIRRLGILVRKHPSQVGYAKKRAKLMHELNVRKPQLIEESGQAPDPPTVIT